MIIERLRRDIAELVRGLPDEVLPELVRERLEGPCPAPARPKRPAEASPCPAEAPAIADVPSVEAPLESSSAPGPEPARLFDAAELLADRRSDEAERLRLEGLVDLAELPSENVAPPEVPVSAPVPASESLTREQRRSRRKREIRGRTISVRRMTKRELEVGRALYPETDYYKPRSRAECLGGPRPCPFVSCAHHLYLDVSPRTGAIKLNFPDLEPDELTESCALDVADRGGETPEDAGAILNLTRERIRQVEVTALAKPGVRPMLRDFAPEGPARRVRRLPVLAPDELEDDEAEEDDDDA